MSKMRSLARLCVCIVGVSTAVAQIDVLPPVTGGIGGASNGPSRTPGQRTLGASILSPYNSVCMMGGPYSADLVTESVRTLADGKRVTQNSLSRKIYRDSQGRTRLERPISMVPPGNSGPFMIEIRDCVAGVAYLLYSETKLAYRVALRPSPSGVQQSGQYASVSLPRQSPGAQVSSTVLAANGVQVKNEALGRQVLDGVETEGTRITRTFPAGYDGADRPITSVNEFWTSRYFDRNQASLSIGSDPRSGETTARLVNVRLTEPDPALFFPPADYTVQDAPGPSVRFLVPIPPVQAPAPGVSR
jgi:hypothetical protein